MEQNSSIITKIEALLRLAARSPFKAEMENAMARAHAIGLRHKIDISKLSIEERNQEQFAKEIIVEGQRLPVMFPFISPILLKFYKVQVLRSVRNRKTTLFFVGRPTEIKIARFTFNFLTLTFHKLWIAEKQAKNLSTFYKKSFCMGLRDGLENRLYSIEKETIAQQEQNVRNQFALMIKSDAEELKSALTVMFGKVKFRKPRNIKVSTEIYNHGLEKGKMIEINKPLAN